MKKNLQWKVVLTLAVIAGAFYPGLDRLPAPGFGQGHDRTGIIGALRPGQKTAVRAAYTLLWAWNPAL